MAIITISRTSFSGGKTIAEEIAKRLGYPLFNRKELIHKASEDFEMPETKLVEAMDELPKLWQHKLEDAFDELAGLTVLLAKTGNFPTINRMRKSSRDICSH